MQHPDAELYLPLCESTLRRVLDASVSWEEALDDTTLPELATLWLLNVLGSHDQGRGASIERVLASIIDLLGEEKDKSHINAVRMRGLQELARVQIQAGYFRLGEHSIQLLDSDTCDRGAYLTADGRWNYDFTGQHRAYLAAQRQSTTIGDRHYLLSAEQSRLYKGFQSEPDEHIHVQGYAGTGKTLLIKSLLNLFEHSAGRILVLAQFKRQLDALGVLRHEHARIRACTFGELAELVIPADLTSAANRNMLRQHRTRATQSDEELIRHLGVQSYESHSSARIIAAVRGTVYRFCLSADSAISERHIPARHLAGFQPLMQGVVAEYARQLWQVILSRGSADFRPQIRDFHRIKWAALNRWPIPDGFTHVLVDECHDLPPPVYQILNCSPQARATLGDDYQNLYGRSTPRNPSIRQREMVESVRSGQAVESIVNPIIQIHPSRTKVLFRGNHNAKLEVRYYRKAEIPDAESVILSSSIWGLFEWSQRLTQTSVQPCLLGDLRDLDMFVQDLLELKAGRSGTRHAELFRYGAWEQLAAAQTGNRCFKRVEQMLDSGYQYSHWKQTYLRFQKNAVAHCLLGLVEHVRNLEFDSVMLTPDVVEARDNCTRAAFAAMVYVAVTRARRQLIVPESLREWVEEITAIGV
ncbi:MAG: AAA family ATPase [Granulosicoccus sp.]